MTQGRGEDRPTDAQRLAVPQLLSLLELCHVIGLDLDLDALLQTIISTTPRMVSCEEASILLVTEEKDEVVFHTMASDRAEKLKKIRLEYGEGISGWVVASGEPVIANDVKNDPRHCQRVDNEVVFRTRNMVCVPIKIKDDVVGALTAVNKNDAADFNEVDLALCQAIANHASIALERARLIEVAIRSARLASIGETVAGLAHCVKNILNGLKGGAYIVNSGLEHGDVEKVKVGWRNMEKGVSRISSLVLDMLTYSKERAPQCAEVDLDELIKEAVETLTSEAAKVDVEISYRTPAGPLRACVDDREIYRCLVNLITNAVDACVEQGGQVLIEAREAEDGWCAIDVIDNGSGMDDAVLQKLFTKLFSTKGSRGTGLGLPTTQKIIKEHGGSISVMSKLGEGSTFSFRLPGKPLTN